MTSFMNGSLVQYTCPYCWATFKMIKLGSAKWRHEQTKHVQNFVILFEQCEMCKDMKFSIHLKIARILQCDKIIIYNFILIVCNYANYLHLHTKFWISLQWPSEYQTPEYWTHLNTGLFSIRYSNGNLQHKKGNHTA